MPAFIQDKQNSVSGNLVAYLLKNKSFLSRLHKLLDYLSSCISSSEGSEERFYT